LREEFSGLSSFQAYIKLVSEDQSFLTGCSGSSPYLSSNSTDVFLVALDLTRRSAKGFAAFDGDGDPLEADG
jgi:hypothetical protein